MSTQGLILLSKSTFSLRVKISVFIYVFKFKIWKTKKINLEFLLICNSALLTNERGAVKQTDQSTSRIVATVSTERSNDRTATDGATDSTILIYSSLLSFCYTINVICVVFESCVSHSNYSSCLSFSRLIFYIFLYSRWSQKYSVMRRDVICAGF